MIRHGGNRKEAIKPVKTATTQFSRHQTAVGIILAVGLIVTIVAAFQARARVMHREKTGSTRYVNDFDRWMVVVPPFINRHVPYTSDTFPTPPVTLAIFGPLTWFSPPNAEWIWALCKYFFSVGIFWAVYRIARQAGVKLSMTAVLLMLAPSPPLPLPKLLWNATASTPVGLYRLQPINALNNGDLVAALPPEPVASFLAQGGFLPRGVPLLKHVAALAGQTICRAGNTVTIDGVTIGIALDRDHLGRPLPRWSGCRRLRPGEIFLMNAGVPDSLDGRYFGPLPITSIIGRATPLWLVSHSNDAGAAADAGAIFFQHPTKRTTP